MKLLYCRDCTDIVKLTDKPRSCECGHSTGRYVTNGVVVLQGPSLSVAMNNFTFDSARETRVKTGTGTAFDAWFMKTRHEEVQRAG